ncbi:transcription factor TFIIIC subunit TFC4 [Spizellomyces punctatus DAOM BR117]|uniref:TPR-like protein n=1 Tax=Spizellomyces punctatus (strain DAOM BR117) TaxID=645134 RepID=A0A0L0HHR6_SPIPD|nr:transcription factor TFIIIC subunit TFC4 [Spizellomyces punctatus DAOM BR117]KND00364.1 hypothetical protein SPPG_09217 [Spizellomyces punctatus DAOM BR117]|eukprot:XP_016608403.1 hypothetical protein SPPG_09217 [Spizellomyces punctatus DAOM BR117]
MEEGDTSFLEILNADPHAVANLIPGSHHSAIPPAQTQPFEHTATWQAQHGFGGVWTGHDEGGLEDAEGEDEEEEEDEEAGIRGDAELTELPEEPDDIPDDVGRQMDQATAEVGIKDHSQILWEEDEEAMREIQESVGELDGDWEGIGRRRRKRRRGKRKKRTELSEAQAEIVGHANIAYSQGDYTRAVKLLHEVIQAAPNAYQAWVTLAMVHDELGDAVKAMRTYMMAAHISPKDGDLWRRLGVMSRKFGHNEQALYCYSKAISADPTDVDALWDRSVLYYERRMLQKAIDDLQAILDLIPHNMPVVKQLCKIYLDLNDAVKAIALFEGAMNADIAHPLQVLDDSDEEGDDANEEVIGGISMGARTAVVRTRMRYEELNMLAELYIEVGEHEKALNAIIQGTRRLQGRAHETHWDQFDDDREFLQGTLPEGMELPIDLQVKLGICRLWLDNAEVAKAHFRPLYARPINDYTELYFDVAEAYMGKRMFTSALAVFEALRNNPQTDTPAIWSKMAFCYQQLGNLELAAELYSAVLDAAPDDFDVKLALAGVYEELGEEDRAFELVSEVDTQSRAVEEEERAKESEQSQTQSASHPSFIREKDPTGKPIQDRAIAEAAEAARQRENRANYQKLLQLYPKCKDRIARADLLRTTRKLLTRFQNTRAFYPSDRAKVFTGLNNRRKRRTATMDEEINDLTRRLRPELLVDTEQRIDRPPPNISSFQGLTFDEWYDVFVKYAYVAVMDGKEDDAQTTLKAAFDANVFYHDELRKVRLRLHMISVAIYAGNAARVTDICRWFCQYRPFSNDVYRLYSAMQAGGSEAVSCYAMNSSVKYFMRQLKAMNKAGKAHPNKPEYKNALLMTTYGHILQAGRSYLGAIAFYLKAYHLCPNDPLINFSLGLAHLHRGMQRKSDNRHMHIMQGFTFIMRYYELRNENVEASYNVGRAFHQIGLTHLAIPYYEKVLQGSDKGKTVDAAQDLKGEAAYNLSMIYVGNGSMGLAEQLLKKYCTF